MCRSLKDGVLVFGKDVEPVADVVGMVFPDLRRDVEVGAQEGGAKLCDELLGHSPRRRSVDGRSHDRDVLRDESRA